MRKEIKLPKEVLATLQKLADKDVRSLKSYMELVLITHTQERGQKSKK